MGEGGALKTSLPLRGKWSSFIIEEKTQGAGELKCNASSKVSLPRSSNSIYVLAPLSSV